MNNERINKENESLIQQLNKCLEEDFFRVNDELSTLRKELNDKYEQGDFEFTKETGKLSANLNELVSKLVDIVNLLKNVNYKVFAENPELSNDINFILTNISQPVFLNHRSCFYGDTIYSDFWSYILRSRQGVVEKVSLIDPNILFVNVSLLSLSNDEKELYYCLDKSLHLTCLEGYYKQIRAFVLRIICCYND